MNNTEYKWILFDDNNGEHEVFESEDELEEYLEEQGYDQDALDEGVRVFRVDKEYIVNANNSFELEEV